MKDSTKKMKKRSLVLTLILSIGGTIAFFNVLQTFSVARSARMDLVADATDKYSEISNAYALAMENDLWGYKQELNYYINADIMKTGSLEEMAAWLRAHESERTADFDYIMLCGPEGRSYNDIGSRTDIKNRSYFKAIMEEGKDEYIDDPVISKTTGKPVVHITRAIKRNGRNFAMLCGVVNVSDLTEEFYALKIGENGYTWMLASDGTVISHPRKDFIMTKNFITGLSEGFEDMAAVAERIANGEQGNAWVNGLNGGKDFIVYHGIEGTPWGLAITIPQNQIYKVINKIRYQMIGFGTIVVVMTIIVGSILLVKTIKPLSGSSGLQHVCPEASGNHRRSKIFKR